MFSTLYRILLADSNEHTLEKMFAEVKQTLSSWGLQISCKNIKKVIILILQHIKYFYKNLNP